MQAIWIALGGNAAFLIVVAFLGKSVIKHWLETDLGRHKQELSDASSHELESLKQTLQVATNEHSILLARLQDRRATVIDSIYSELAIGVRELESYLRPLQLVGEDDRPTKAKRARDALMKALHSFDERQIWLTADCAERVEKLMEILRQTFNRYDILRQSAERRPNDTAMGRESDAWMSAWDRVTGEVAVARKALEAEMRKLLEPIRPN